MNRRDALKAAIAAPLVAQTAEAAGSNDLGLVGDIWWLEYGDLVETREGKVACVVGYSDWQFVSGISGLAFKIMSINGSVTPAWRPRDELMLLERGPFYRALKQEHGEDYPVLEEADQGIEWEATDLFER